MPRNGGGNGGFKGRGQHRGGANGRGGVVKKNRGRGGGNNNGGGGGGGQQPRSRDIWADVEIMKRIALAPDTKAQIQLLWDGLDIDKDGFLTLVDFQNILSVASMSPSVAQSKAVAVFTTLQQELDFNRDDKITPHEFAEGLITVSLKARSSPTHASCAPATPATDECPACASAGAIGHDAPHAAISSRLDHVPADAYGAGGKQQHHGVLQADLQFGPPGSAGLLRAA